MRRIGAGQINWLLAVLFVFGAAPAFSETDSIDPREIAVDRAVGGMDEGSRIVAPQGNGGRAMHSKAPGSGLSPSMDTHVAASAPGQVVRPSASAGIGNIAGEPAGGINHAEVETGTGIIDPGNTGGSQDSIIEVDANLDITSDGVQADADLAIDPNAGGGLLDADTTTTVDQSTDITGQELADPTLLEGTVDSELAAEVGITESPAASEADAGLEADIEGTGSGDDVTADPSDGLSSAPKI